MADIVQNIQHRPRIVELNFKQRIVTRRHGRFDAFVFAQQQLCARLRRFRGADVGQHALIIQHALDQHFNLSAAGFTAKHARRNNAGIVKHQQIARVELFQQIGESAMRQRAGWPVKRQ